LPKVSIIIPVYNVEKFLRECLDSVVNQTLKDIEIICINDCSPDNSLKILEEYASKDNRIKIIDNETNLGLGQSRNNAIKVATGDYIMFLDSDDWLKLNACELAYNQISKNNNDFVHFEVFKYFQDAKKLVPANRLIKFKNILNNPKATVKDIGKSFYEHSECWSKIFNRNFLIKNNIEFGDGAFEDYIFNLFLFIYAESISVLSETLIYWRRWDGSITNSAKNYFVVIEKNKACLKYLDENNIPNKIFFLNSKLVHSIKGCILYLNKSRLNDIKYYKQLYKETHKFFLEISNKYDISAINDYINYKEYYKILKYNFYAYEFLNFLPNIFSIKGETKKGVKRKVVTFLGLKFKFRLGLDG